MMYGKIQDEDSSELKQKHNNEQFEFYDRPDTIQTMRSRRLIWAGLVGKMGEEKTSFRVLMGHFEKAQWVDLEASGQYK